MRYQSLTESVGVERQTLELQEVPDGGGKNLDLVPGQVHRPQVSGESLQLLRELKHRQEVSQRDATTNRRYRPNRLNRPRICGQYYCYLLLLIVY